MNKMFEYIYYQQLNLSNYLLQKKRKCKKLIKNIIRKKEVGINSARVVSDNTKYDFDANYYLAAYPDIEKAKVDPYEHFVNQGRFEGRIAKHPLLEMIPIDKKKKTVLLVSHDATRTGAPILAANIGKELLRTHNVICLLLGPGEIASFFEAVSNVLVGPIIPTKNLFSDSFIAYNIDRICERFSIDYALVNSMESRCVLPHLNKKGIPSVCMVHEFFGDTSPCDEFLSGFLWASEVVFPSEIVKKSALNSYTNEMIKDTLILRQGKSEIPKNAENAVLNNKKALYIKRKINNGSKKTVSFVVLGAGTIYQKKGVDLFVSVATEIKRIDPTLPIVMVWVGAYYDPEYSEHIGAKIIASKISKTCLIFDPVENLEEIYKMADVFFLSSRVDPLPNVAIDAMLEGIPLICFSNTTGIEEVLTQDEITRSCLVPNFDIKAAANKIIEIYSSSKYKSDLEKRVKKLAKINFNMNSYVKSLEQLAQSKVPLMKQEKLDAQVIMDSNKFNQDFFLSHTNQDIWETVRLYLRLSQKKMPHRKPCPGFSEGLYRDLYGIESKYSNPFADYIRRGCPVGPWQERVLSISEASVKHKSKLRCALQIHVFYIDLLEDILSRLKMNEVKCDLFISTITPEILVHIKKMLKSYKDGKVTIRVVPNSGRNFGPLLSEFALELQNYDLIGHVHTKKSESYIRDNNFSEGAKNTITGWRNFLLENMIGGKFCAADQIIDAFEKDKNLGLVYPCDPNKVGWCSNKEIADDLGAKMGLNALPQEIDSFPVGSMFWARPKALFPLFNLNMTWEDYPLEPLPYDGTVLHAIERLLPYITRNQNFTHAVTYVSGINR